MFQLPGSTSSSSDSIDVDYMNIPDFYLPRDYNSTFSRPILRNSSYFFIKLVNRNDYNNVSSGSSFLIEDNLLLPSFNFLGNRRSTHFLT